jgi:hypothetical protein
MDFTSFVANIALLILLIALVGIGYTMYKSKNKFVADNVVIGECPDYWNMVNEDGNNYCVNAKNFGKSECSSKMNFFTQPWNTGNGMCNKYNWANQCELTWDGITNNPNACSTGPRN